MENSKMRKIKAVEVGNAVKAKTKTSNGTSLNDKVQIALNAIVISCEVFNETLPEISVNFKGGEWSTQDTLDGVVPLDGQLYAVILWFEGVKMQREYNMETHPQAFFNRLIQKLHVECIAGAIAESKQLPLLPEIENSVFREKDFDDILFGEKVYNVKTYELIVKQLLPGFKAEEQKKKFAELLNNAKNRTEWILRDRMEHLEKQIENEPQEEEKEKLKKQLQELDKQLNSILDNALEV
jgi:hypothetical protein